MAELLDKGGIRTLCFIETIQSGRSCGIPSASHVIMTDVECLIFVNINSFNFHAGHRSRPKDEPERPETTQ